MDEVARMLERYRRRKRREKIWRRRAALGLAEVEPPKVEAKFLGVYVAASGGHRRLSRPKYIPRVKMGRRTVHLGYRETAPEAARARDAAIRRFGLKLPLNYPEGDDEVRSNEALFRTKFWAPTCPRWSLPGRQTKGGVRLPNLTARRP